MQVRKKINEKDNMEEINKGGKTRKGKEVARLGQEDTTTQLVLKSLDVALQRT
jgi:hypothetical protein